MSGVPLPNVPTGPIQTPTVAAPPAPPAPAAPAAPVAPGVPAAPPVPAIGTDSLAIGGAAADLNSLRAKAMVGTEVDAALAISQMEAMAGQNRAQVIALLTENVQMAQSPVVVSASVQALQRLGATEALPVLQRLANDGRPIASDAARQAVNALGGTPAAPAAPAAPVSPTRPVVGPASSPPGAPATPAAAPAQAPATSSYAGRASDLVPLLSNIDTAPNAAVELMKLPTADFLAVTGQLLNSKNVEPRVLDLVVTVMSKRLKEPGVTQQLQAYLKQDPSRMPSVSGKAAMALLSTHDPKYFPDIAHVLVAYNARLNPIKQAIIDTMAKDPRYLNLPTAGPIFGAVLKANEDDKLSAAASHALSMIKTSQSRDALAASPLLYSTDPKMKMRAMWDLSVHPAPYPPVAVGHLKDLANDKDPTVAKKAKELLARKS